MPVYLFTGFLESGKTKFIQETLEDKRFCNKEKTLLLVCEEGEEEYAPEQFATDTVVIRVLEGQEQLTTENLTKWAQETKADRVVIEYNGMWLLDALYAAMPEGWVVYQEFMFADAGTFLSYNGNMRQLVYDKLKSCELVVFNRFKPDMDKMEFHKVVRAASRRADIAYESTDGKVVYDDIEDPLPFDLNAPVIEIGDADFAEWYRDLGETPANYEGKTVRFKCRALKRSKMPANTFIVGRHVMTCCVEDIQYCWLVAQDDRGYNPENQQWINITGKISVQKHKLYKGKGLVLFVKEITSAEGPENPVATFY